MADQYRTQPDLLNNVFPDNQAAGSITAGDMRDLIKSAPYLQTAGWDFHLDGTYTSSNKRTILTGARTQVTIDGAAGNFGHPLDTNGNHPEFWFHDTIGSDDYIQPSGLNDFGIVRLAFQAEHTEAAQSAYITLELDVGGGAFPIIYEEDRIMVRGQNTPQWFNFTLPLFAGPDFQTNGGRLYITPSHSSNFWDFAFTGARIYAANPAGNPGGIL
jgi:hypothetical protein